jgi:hypothetical protein
MDTIIINFKSDRTNNHALTVVNRFSEPVNTLFISDSALLDKPDIGCIFSAAAKNQSLTRISIFRPESERDMRFMVQRVEFIVDYNYYIPRLKMCILLNERLTYLDLMWCRFSEESILDLVEWISNWSNLKVFTLKDPYHTTATLVKVTALLAENNTLEQVVVDLIRNKSTAFLDVADIKKIRANIKRNTRMQSCNYALDTHHMRQTMEMMGPMNRDSELHRELNEIFVQDEHSLNDRATLVFKVGKPSGLKLSDLHGGITDWIIRKSPSLNGGFTARQMEDDFVREVFLLSDEPVLDQCKFIKRFDFADINMEAGLPEFLVGMCCNVVRLSFVNCSLQNNTISDAPPAAGLPVSLGEREECGHSRRRYAEPE